MQTVTSQSTGVSNFSTLLAFKFAYSQFLVCIHGDLTSAVISFWIREREGLAVRRKVVVDRLLFMFRNVDD